MIRSRGLAALLALTAAVAACGSDGGGEDRPGDEGAVSASASVFYIGYGGGTFGGHGRRPDPVRYSSVNNIVNNPARTSLGGGGFPARR